MFTVEGRVVVIFEDIVQSLLNMCCFNVCFLVLTNHIPIKYRTLVYFILDAWVHITSKEVNEISYNYFSLCSL